MTVLVWLQTAQLVHLVLKSKPGSPLFPAKYFFFLYIRIEMKKIEEGKEKKYKNVSSILFFISYFLFRLKQRILILVSF